MKKAVFKTFYIVIFIFILTIICSCSSNHEHMFSDEWSFDQNYHFHQATCEHKEEKQNMELHTYGDWQIIEEATENKEGRKIRECKVCKYQETESISKLHIHQFSKDWTFDAMEHWHQAICEHKNEKSEISSHQYGQWEIIKEPQGQEDGERKRICSVCKYEQVESFGVHEHVYSKDWTSDASGHWHQAICEHPFERTELEEHIYGNWIIVKNPTETESGIRKKVCSICNYEKNESIDEMNHEHTYGDWEVAESPTKTSKGVVTRVCESNSSHIEIIELPVLDQENYNYFRSEPSCYDAGYEEFTYRWMSGFTFKIELPSTGHSFSLDWTFDQHTHWHQAVCEHSDLTTTPEPHSFGDWVIIKPATEEEEGQKVKMCSSCKYEIFETIDKLEHTHRYSANWSQNSSHHWHAAVCIHKEEKMDYAEHNFGDWVIIQEATPTQAEILKRNCLTCNYEETINNGHLHTFSPEYIKTETMHWKECACGERIEEEEHTFGDWEYLKDPTNTEEGLKKKVCSICKYEFFETIDRLDHIHIFENAWTFNETKHWQNAVCHPDEKRNEDVHHYGPWQIVEEATETQVGKQKRGCVVCGYEDIEDIPKKPHTHSYSNWIVVETPTKASKGLMQRTCLVDQYSQSYELPELSEENYSYEKIDSTCQTKGKEVYTLIKDKQTLEFIVELNLIAHSYIMEYDEHTHWRKCKMCGRKTDEENHNLYYNECQVCHFQFYTEGINFILKEDYTYQASIEQVTSEEVIIPSHYLGDLVTSIECDTKNSYVKKLVLPQSVLNIGQNVIANCPNIVLNSDAGQGQYLGNEENPYLWLIKPINKDISSCILHSETKYIYNNAFANCKYLINIQLNANLEKIESDAFIECNSLTNVYFLGSIEDWSNIEIAGIYSTPMCYADHFFLKNGESWREVTTLEIQGTQMYISTYQFYGFSNISQLILHPGVTQIGMEAFAECSNLSYVFVPNTVSYIEISAFTDCAESIEFYYEGSKTDWDQIYNEDAASMECIYFYSEQQPSSGNYWHYVDGQIVKWEIII